MSSFTDAAPDQELADDHPRDALLVRPLDEPGTTSYHKHIAAVATGAARSGSSTDGAARLRYHIGAFHDFGKATAYFQEYVREERERSRWTNHSALGALAAFYTLDEADTTPVEKALAWYTIHRHHGSMIDIDDCYARAFDADREEIEADQLAALRPYADMIEAAYADLSKPIELDVRGFIEWATSDEAFDDVADALGYTFGSVDRSYLPPDSAYDVLDAYGHLIAADRLDASGIDPPDRRELDADLIEQYVSERFDRPTPGSINALREAGRRTAEHTLRRTWAMADAAGVDDDAAALPNRYNLSLPTGLGKTLTGLHAALLLRERIAASNDQDQEPEPPRIIYVLPYTSIIDQVVADIGEVYATAEPAIPATPTTLLKHHYLSAGYREADEYTVREQALLGDRWESEVVVTTYVQLIEALLTPTPSQALRYPALSRSILVLDEPQSLLTDYWPAIDETLTWISEQWETTVISMTATHPRVASDDQNGDDSRPFLDGTPLIPHPEQFHARLDRVRYRLDDSVTGSPLSVAEWARRGIEHARAEPDDDVLMICNTLRAAERVYDQVVTAIAHGELDGRVRYLSSNVRPIDRAERIAALSDASDADQDRQIIVSTQVVETGVDLDADHLLRDYAPLDTIVQAAGRCNRHALAGESAVEVVRMAPLTTDEPPCEQVYDDVKLDMTRRVLGSHGHGAVIPEAIMTDALVPRYFDELADQPILDDPRDPLQAWEFERAAVSLIPDGDEYQLFICRDASDEDVLRAFATALDEGDRETVEDLKAPFYERIVSGRENQVDTVVLDPDAGSGLADGIDLLDADRRLYAITDPVADRWYDDRVGLRVQ